MYIRTHVHTYPQTYIYIIDRHTCIFTYVCVNCSTKPSYRDITVGPWIPMPHGQCNCQVRRHGRFKNCRGPDFFPNEACSTHSYHIHFWIHAHMHICTHVQRSTHICVYIHRHIICIHVCMCIYIYACIYLSIYIHMYVCMYVCM